ncbi:MAG: hypothetical protein DI535_04885 [Citrobacter freundii]|nr:MAG: hypothetical protein DI535_04885 [Citrobacter freundii]
MKTKAILRSFSVLLMSIFLAACSKNTSPPAPPVSNTFPLYNHSSGTAKAAGSFTLFQLEGGKVSINIQLDADYFVPGIMLDAYLVTCDTCSLIYTSLGSVNGNTGAGSTPALKTNGNNEAILYDSLITKKGYAVKILNGSNVQAVGAIQ